MARYQPASVIHNELDTPEPEAKAAVPVIADTIIVRFRRSIQKKAMGFENRGMGLVRLLPRVLYYFIV